MNMILLLANHAEPLPQGFCLANDFAPADDGWVQLVPYGDYIHSSPLGTDGKPLKKDGKVLFPRGVVQRIDNEAAQILVTQFNDTKALKPNFVGLPWYIGHHDLDPVKYPDPKSYGWIQALANRADGLYAKVDWTPEGKELIEKKAFKLFSPFFFRAENTGQVVGGRGVVRPTELKSVAFTNNPNIDVMPLANEAAKEAPVVDETAGAAFLIANAIDAGVLTDGDREAWLAHFAQDFKGATMVLANAGTSEGARKGWETRRAGMASKDPAKKAAKVAARTAKGGKGAKAKKAGPAPGSANKSVRAALANKPKATPPPLPKPAATPPPLPKTPSVAARIASRAVKLFSRSR